MVGCDVVAYVENGWSAATMGSGDCDILARLRGVRCLESGNWRM
jgi:hypothetical protein